MVMMAAPFEIIQREQIGSVTVVSFQTYTTTATIGQDTMLALKPGYLTWVDDPVLAELWDNDEDAAAFDNI